MRVRWLREDALAERSRSQVASKEQETKMPYMYILECADGSYYTGSTWDMEKRMWEHQNGQGANHTARHLPVKLVYVEEGDRIEDAYFREKQVQGWSRKKKQALIAGDSNALHRLAECRNDTHWSGFTSTGSAAFGSAQATATAAAAAAGGSSRSLSEVKRSLSEAEGNNPNDNINNC
jgi:putative endonuclease